MSESHGTMQPHGGRSRLRPLALLVGLVLLLMLIAEWAIWFLDGHAKPEHPSFLSRWADQTGLVFTGGHHQPITFIAYTLGLTDGDVPCNDIALLWAGIVFCAGLLIALLIWFELTQLRGLRAIFEAPWSGLGQDVETAGMIEALLRLAVVLSAVLLCLGLVSIADAGEYDAKTSCYLPKSDPPKTPEIKPPTVSLAWPPYDPGPQMGIVPIVVPIEAPATENSHRLDEIDQSLKSISDIAAASKATADHLVLVDVATELHLIDQHLVTLDEEIRKGGAPLNIQISGPGASTGCPICCKSPGLRRPDPPHGSPVRCSTASLPKITTTPPADSVVP